MIIEIKIRSSESGPNGQVKKGEVSSGWPVGVIYSRGC